MVGGCAEFINIGGDSIIACTWAEFFEVNIEGRDGNFLCNDIVAGCIFDKGFLIGIIEVEPEPNPVDFLFQSFPENKFWIDP